MKPASLRARLTLVAGATIALALLFAWGALSLLFERHLERQTKAELERLGGVLAASLAVSATGAPTLAAPPSDPRFQTPGSGLYWRLSTKAGALASRSLWDGALPRAEPARADAWAATIGKGPFEDEVMLVQRLIRPAADGPSVLVQIGADHAAVDAAQAAFAGELALSLVVLWAVLLLAAWAQVRWGLKPMSAVPRALDQLKADAKARLVARDFPTEIAPLAEKINALADARARDMVRARSRAQDLAHALKTPLTALKLQVAALPRESRGDLERSLFLLQQSVGAELAVASWAEVGGARIALAPVIDRLISVVSRAYPDRALRFLNQCDDTASAPIAEEAALELIGALLDNAAKHARNEVRIRAQTASGVLRLTIDDDGPGIPEDQMANALQRGVRLDERGEGQGLGLAVAADLARQSGGSLHLARSALGGLSVGIFWSSSPSTQTDTQT